jgi:DNA-binding transcriptional MerR regulator
VNKKTYSPKEVCKFAKISARQLGYWKLIGIVRPTHDLRGSRMFYRYSEGDLNLLIAVQKMTEQGYLVSKAADKIKAALSRGEEVTPQSLFNLISPQAESHAETIQAEPKPMETFQKRIEEELTRSRRFNYPLSCLAIRVEISPSDNEEVVRHLTQKILAGLGPYKRAYDMIVQSDRQEILWLLCQSTEEAARHVASRVPQMIPERETVVGSARYKITVRAVSGTVHPAKNDGADLVARAREALNDSIERSNSES